MPRPSAGYVSVRLLNMGWKEFAASVVGSVAWPVAILILGIVFRKQLIELLKRLQDFKVPGAEATFAAGLDKVELRLGDLKATEDKAVAEQVSEDSKTNEEPASMDSSATDPTGTVIRSWEELAKAVIGLLPPDPRNRRHLNIIYVVRRLVAQGDISELFAETVMDLYRLRTQVAHGKETPTSESALMFARTADEMRRAAIATAKVRGRDEASPQPS